GSAKPKADSWVRSSDRSPRSSPAASERSPSSSPGLGYFPNSDEREISTSALKQQRRPSDESREHPRNHRRHAARPLEPAVRRSRRSMDQTGTRQSRRIDQGPHRALDGRGRG